MLSGDGWVMVEIHQATWLKTTTTLAIWPASKAECPKNRRVGEYLFGKIVA
jgi:hypothetical protein